MRSISLTLSIISALAISCSSQAGQLQKREAREEIKRRDQSTTAQFNPLGDLLSQAQDLLKAIEDPSPKATATTRFLVLHGRAIGSDDEAQRSLATLHFSLTTKALQTSEVNALVRSKLVDRFQVASLSGDEALPINLNALKPSADKIGIKISDYQGLTFVSYHGQALKGGLQLKTTCQVASGLAESEMLRSPLPPMIASLSTLEVMDTATHSARCADRNELWIRPVAELDKGGVRLISRGLNQWGRPELELGPLARNHAPKRFPLFMHAIEAMQSAKLETVNRIKIGQRHFKLADCLRPSHHYDEGCRRLIVP